MNDRKARWQVATVSPDRGYYVVARPLTAREAQAFLDGLPFPAFVEPLPRRYCRMDGSLCE
jgi:hypothetical protein